MLGLSSNCDKLTSSISSTASFIEQIIGWALALAGKLGYPGSFLLSVLDRVTISLIPSEILLPLYGFLISRGEFSFLPVFLFISLGSLLGEIVLYWIFARGGRPFLEKYGKYFLVYKHDLEHLDRLFAKHGAKLVFWGRFLPAVRSIVAIPAGVSRLNFKKYSVYSFLGLLPYNFLLIFLGQKTGDNFEKIRPIFDIAEKIGFIILIMLAAWYVYRHLKKRHFTHG